MGEMVWLFLDQHLPQRIRVGGGLHTLNEALYGIAIGRFAKMAIIRFALADLKAKLCEIS